jgi:oligopeptide transport system substrate-binding protein
MKTRQSWKTYWLLSLSTLMLLACVLPTSSLDSQPSTAATLNKYGIPRENTLVEAYYEVETLDPAKWLYGAEDIISDLYSGLVRQSAGLKPVPDLAESWDVSPDGTVYTFHLRKGVIFHDGRPFTAQDVRYSWERAVSPATGSNTALTYLNDIRGVREMADGDASSISGLRVVDDDTLEVTLEAPAPYFLYKIAMPVAWVVDSETVDQIETAPNGTGPFSFVRHDENEVFIVKRNPNYYLEPAALDYVVYLMYAGYPVRLYEAGDIDLVQIDKDLLERAENPSDPLYGNVQAISPLCTDFVAFDVSQPPFDDPLVRQAFVQAVDRERYDEAILEGEGLMAGGLYPPGLTGYMPDVQAPQYDSAAAAQDLHDSSYGSPENLPEIVYTTYGSSGNVSSSDGLLIQMWQDVLGVQVTPEGLDPLDFLEQVYSGKHGQIVNSGWCADYTDPENFAELFHSRSWQNHGHYSNPAYDALLDKARAEKDAAMRIQLYQQAEQLLLDDSAALFLSYTMPYYVVTKPYLDGYVASPIGVVQHVYLSMNREK